MQFQVYSLIGISVWYHFDYHFHYTINAHSYLDVEWSYALITFQEPFQRKKTKSPDRICFNSFSTRKRNVIITIESNVFLVKNRCADILNNKRCAKKWRAEEQARNGVGKKKRSVNNFEARSLSSSHLHDTNPKWILQWAKDTNNESEIAQMDFQKSKAEEEAKRNQMKWEKGTGRACREKKKRLLFRFVEFLIPLLGDRDRKRANESKQRTNRTIHI